MKLCNALVALGLLVACEPPRVRADGQFIFKRPAAAGATANLWIDEDGGGCARSSSPAAYVDADACGSIAAAYAAASGGDTIRMPDGTTLTASQSCSGTKASTVTLIGGSNAQISVTGINEGLYFGCTNFVVDNVDVNGTYANVHFNGGAVDVTWKNSERGADSGLRVCGDEGPGVPIKIYSDGDTIERVTIQNVVLNPLRIDPTSGCPTPPPHAEHIRIDQNVNDVVLDRLTLVAGGEDNTAHIFITTPNTGTTEPFNITIRNSRFFGHDGSYHISIHSNVGTCTNYTFAYNTFGSHEGFNWGCAARSNVLVVGNVGFRPQTCLSGVTWTANVWQWSTGTACGTDTRVPGSNFSIDQLGLDANLLPESGSPVIDAGEATCPTTANGEDRDGDTRPEGDACDAGADEFGATGGDAASVQHEQPEIRIGRTEPRRTANRDRHGHARLIGQRQPAAGMRPVQQHDGAGDQPRLQRDERVNQGVVGQWSFEEDRINLRARMRGEPRCRVLAVTQGERQARAERVPYEPLHILKGLARGRVVQLRPQALHAQIRHKQPVGGDVQRVLGAA